MLDPSLLGGTPFKSRTAFEDLIGEVASMHAILIEATIRTTGNVPRRYTFDSGNPQTDLLQAIEAQHQSLAKALGIAAPQNLQSFDLSDESDFSSWTFVLAADLTRLRDAAGVV